MEVKPGTPGGTDLERGYGDVRPWRPLFHASPAARKGPISSKRVSSQDPLLRKFGNFSLYSLNFHPNFSSQAPKFGNFQLTSPPNLEIFSSQAPKFGNFPLTSPPFQRQMSVRKPHTSEIRAAHPYLKKSWVPPPPRAGTLMPTRTWSALKTFSARPPVLCSKTSAGLHLSHLWYNNFNGTASKPDAFSTSQLCFIKFSISLLISPSHRTSSMYHPPSVVTTHFATSNQTPMLMSMSTPSIREPSGYGTDFQKQ